MKESEIPNKCIQTIKNLITIKKLLNINVSIKVEITQNTSCLTHFIPWNVVSIRDESVQVIKESGFEFMFSQKHALLSYPRFPYVIC